jgi:orotidine-5'-phosphate decarboxylase
MSFREKWLEAVEKKNSVLCAGIDPAEFDMGRGNKGLPEDVNKKQWALRFIEAVAPYCAAVKPNLQYWKEEGDMGALFHMVSLAHSLDMVVIDDSKLADIGSTNDAGLFYSALKGFDAVTFSPFAGNIGEAARQGRDRGIGVIAMCLMSNAQYAAEKNALVPVNHATYNQEDIVRVNGTAYAKRYITLAHDAQAYMLEGIVIGAPSPDNHIKDEELKKASVYAGPDMLVLLPGLGAQGGEAEKIWQHFSPKNVIVNVGRSLMLPNGSNSTPEEQAETAKNYQDMLNRLRAGN